MSSVVCGSNQVAADLFLRPHGHWVWQFDLFYSYQIKKDQMGKACGTYKGEGKYIHGVGGKN
jgi:hypothetical protein